MINNWDLLLKKAEEFNIQLNDTQINQFKEYWKFLNEYNQHTNLVSNAEETTVVVQHFIDSISIGKLQNYVPQSEKINFIDIGIGGGFPGIPILIANSNWNLCAVDSVGKKTKFIDLLTKYLGLNDRVEIITGRAEELAKLQNKREYFDLAISRAVSKLAVLSEYCLPFVKTDGYFISYKAKDIDEELTQSTNAIKLLGGNLENIISYTLPNEELTERNLITIKKIKPSPAKYPRKAGIPKKTPIM